MMKTVAFVLAAALVAGCGGGGATPNVGAQQGVPQASPPVQKAPQSVSVAFSIAIPTPAPASAHRPAYVSSSTKSASIAVNSGSAVTVNCTTSCTGTVSAPVGSDTFTVKLYDATNAGGSLLSTGSLTQTVVAGQANSVNVTFNGVVASLGISVPTVTPGTSGSVAVSANAFDADGNTIIGPGSYVDASGNPVTITLANSDTSGNSSLSQTTLTAPPASPVMLTYTAAFDANPTISASATALTTADATVHFPAPTFTAMSAWSGKATTTVAETLTGTNFVAGSTTITPPANITITSVSVTNSTTLTANFVVGAAAFGAQNFSITTSNGTSGPQPFSVATGPTYTVTLSTDNNTGTPPGVGGGNAGDLRNAIASADSNPGARIVFSGCTPSAPCTIALNGPLLPMQSNMIIDGGAYGSVIINGQNLYRAFWAESAAIVLENLQIENAAAIGGSGANSVEGGGSGGGAGLGGGLFVDSASANVNLINDYFSRNSGIGGNGGTTAGGGGDAGGSGGGGLSGAGGYGTSGGGGGGGVLSAGSNTVQPGGNGGVGFNNCSGGGTGGAFTSGAAGGSGFSGASSGCAGGGGGSGDDGTAGSGFNGGIGGSGALGAGGGGGGSGGSSSSTNSGNGGSAGSGGPGGFGAGGGGGGQGGQGNVCFCAVGNGGNGGAGGSGGAGGGGGGGGLGGFTGSGTPGLNGAGAAGGNLSASVRGGSGGLSYGGGGAAAGPAIFVNVGTLITFNSGASGCSASGGTAEGSAAPGGFDATPVFNYGGTVNGVSVTAGSGGPVASALGTAVP